VAVVAGVLRPVCRRAEVAALIDAVPEEYPALVVATSGTGLRQGEAFAISTSSIDFLRRVLEVEQQVVMINGVGPQLAPPKTEASRRTLPLPQVVLDALAAHLATFSAGAHGLLFTDGRGQPLRRDSFGRKVWRPAVQAVGLHAGVGFHALRHYYASLLIRHGESVTTVQARLGHKTAKETLDTYSHLWPDSEDRTRAAVDSGLLRRHLSRPRGRGPLTGEVLQ
jgi:integrase